MRSESGPTGARWWTPVLYWLLAIGVAGIVVLGWTFVVLSSASGLGGDQATVITAVSLQVALLNAFFLVVTFGIATLGFFGFRQVRAELRDVAADAARRAVGERLAGTGLAAPLERPYEGEEEEGGRT